MRLDEDDHIGCKGGFSENASTCTGNSCTSCTVRWTLLQIAHAEGQERAQTEKGAQLSGVEMYHRRIATIQN